MSAHPREFNAAGFVLANTIDMSTTEEYGKVWIGELGRWIQVAFTSSASPFSLYWPITVIGTNLGAAVLWPKTSSSSGG